MSSDVAARSPLAGTVEGPRGKQGIASLVERDFGRGASRAEEA